MSWNKAIFDYKSSFQIKTESQLGWKADENFETGIKKRILGNLKNRKFKKI
jgi:dTDP-D-glucose 4,6-dehydratase